jgi:hypothetical protein
VWPITATAAFDVLAERFGITIASAKRAIYSHIKNTMKSETPRFWIWTFVIVQLVGLAVDGFWHGLLHPGFEPQTFGEMVRHLLKVHLLLYIGVVGLLVCTTWALLAKASQSGITPAPVLAASGAAVQTAGEVWHAYSHLAMRPNPIPEIVGFVGLVLAIIASLASGRGAQHAADRE